MNAWEPGRSAEVPPPSVLHGYAEGGLVRRLVYGVAVVATAGAVVAGIRYARYRDTVLRDPAQVYAPVETPPGTAQARPRTLSWAAGRARLGLARRPPSATRILLPDRVIELAPDSAHAQIEVEVRDGRTVRLTTIVGEIVARPRDPAGVPAAETP